ncbi:hypothetical protein INR49_006314 [Caranx melampygus]|nr:hypothetical protein INR49_006314 [Caranx melampygus]
MACFSVRALGTAAVDMCQVATGGADAYYHIGMHCWDIAASAIIVQEAGGVVMDTDGSEFDMMSRRVIAASSPAVARGIAQVIQAFPCRRDDEDPNSAFGRGHQQRALYCGSAFGEEETRTWTKPLTCSSSRGASDRAQVNFSR